VTRAGVNFSVVAPRAHPGGLLLFPRCAARGGLTGCFALRWPPRAPVTNWHGELKGWGSAALRLPVFGPLLPGLHGFFPAKGAVDPCARAIQWLGGSESNQRARPPARASRCSPEARSAALNDGLVPRQTTGRPS